MQVLVDLVKVGAIGASLAFLLLSYWLLNKQLARTDANKVPIPPDPEVLKHIQKFRRSALVYLLIGVVSEFILSNSFDLVHYFLRSELVRVRFDDWEYFPENKALAFGFAQDRIDTGLYVLPSEQKNYQVYVGVRKKTATPYAQGQYDLLFGPYQIETLSRQKVDLTPEQIKALGNDCVEFTVFGIDSGKKGKLTAPVDVSAGPIKAHVFHAAYACVTT